MSQMCLFVDLEMWRFFYISKWVYVKFSKIQMSKNYHQLLFISCYK